MLNTYESQHFNGLVRELSGCLVVVNHDTNALHSL